jgi:hypothetical protein
MRGKPTQLLVINDGRQQVEAVLLLLLLLLLSLLQ